MYACGCAQVFGGPAKSQLDKIHISNTDEVCRDLLWFMQRYPLEVNPKARPVLERGDSRQRERIESIAKILDEDFELPPVDMVLPARPYQEQAAAALFAGGHLLVVDELGLGKTVSAIRMIADARSIPALCVVPSPLTEQWKNQLHKFLPDLRVHIIKSRQIYDIKEDGKDPHVLVISYNMLAAWADMLIGKIRFIVYDEIQELRTGHTEADSSQKNRAAAQISLSADYRCGLTGTPVYNYGGELWNVLDILAPGTLGSRPEFLREWCVGGDQRKARVREPEAFGSYLRSTGVMIRRTRDDVGRHLPPISTIVHEIHEGASSSFFGSESAAAELARIVLDKSAKNFAQMQAAGQFDMMLRQNTGVGKAPHVAAFVRMLLEEETDSVVLFGWHREVYQIWGELMEDLGLAWYTGTESVSKKRKEVDRFLAGDAKVLIMSLRSGLGFDGLQERCATSVFGELDWSPGVHEQCEGRVHREGQKRPVFSHYPIAQFGSDPVICDALGLKKAQVEGIRNPNRNAVATREVDPDHIKKLAADYLRRHEGKA